jgi:hypothetical protein
MPWPRRNGLARRCAFQLATELPAAVLARTLGIDITVAVKWQRAAAGDWAAYAAEVSRRATSQAVHPNGNTGPGPGHQEEQSLVRPHITDEVEYRQDLR